MVVWGGSQSLSNREAAMPASHLRRICLMMGPGTLPSQGRDRMDLTQYNARLSGKPRLTRRAMVAAFPEIANEQATHEDLRRSSRKINGILARGDFDGLVYIQGANTLEEIAYLFRELQRFFDEY